MPSSVSASVAVLLDVPHGRWSGVYGSFITCAPGSAARLEPARQVRVEDVEAAGAEPELARLDVDDHLVAELRPARSAADRRRTARRRPRAATSPSSSLDDGGDASRAAG